MKVTMFEDLIADLYSRLYEINMPLLIEQENEENKEKMKVDHLLMAGDGPTENSTPSTSVPASDAPAPRGRTKGIARRDIQKRADTIVNLKLAPRTATSKLTAAGETEQSSAATAASTTTTTAPASAPRDASKQAPTPGGMDSAQNGGHKDSADDTELSEADRQSKTAEQKLGFTPNLGKSDPVSEAEDTGSGNEGADEGDGDGSEDETGNDHDNDNDNGDGDDDGDQVATEAETDALEGEEGDGDGDGEGGEGDNEPEDEEIQDTEAEPKSGDGNKQAKEGDSNTAEQSSEHAKSKAPVKSEDVAEPEPMDVTPAGQ
jgi:hypothetical protein